ncbi:MAG: carbohydrate ABC transporter permease, partial [Lachnospiraceae bacterium]|nr:carbohydrate ABC transporter permease [Lachnospiraceae bacterium]
MKDQSIHGKIRRSGADIAVSVFSYTFVGLIALACLLPLIMVVSVSLSDNTAVVQRGYSFLPREFTVDTYRYLFAHSGARILRSYLVTITVTVIGTIAAMVITGMCSFALSIKSLKYRNVIA